MANYEVPNPILNSPFEEPKQHWYIEEGHDPDLRGSAAGRGVPAARPADAVGFIRRHAAAIERVRHRL